MSGPALTHDWLASHRLDLDAVDETQVVGIGHVLAEVRSLVGRLAEPGLLAEVGGSLPRGILLWGEPGVGKTLTARILATTLARLAPGVETYELHVDELTPTRIRDAIRYLAGREEPSVLIIDEIDQISMARRSLVPEREDWALLTALLGALDGLRPAQRMVLVATSTTPPNRHDAGLMRPGRIGHHVHVSMPSLAEIHELFVRLTSRVSVDGELDLAWAAAQCDGSTPAEIRGVIEDAIGLAIADGRRSIGQQDLRLAVQRDGEVEPDPEPVPVPIRVAIHEAGHCCAIAAVLGPDAIVSTQVDALGGRTVRRSPPADMIAAVPIADQLALLYAGAVAERHILGSGGPGSQHDIRRATEVLLDAFEQAADPALPPLSLSVLEPVLSETWKVRIGQSVGERAIEAMARAEAIVAANAAAIESFASRLRESRALDGERLQEALDAAAFRDPARPVPAELQGRLPN